MHAITHGQACRSYFPFAHCGFAWFFASPVLISSRVSFVIMQIFLACGASVNFLISCRFSRVSFALLALFRLWIVRCRKLCSSYGPYTSAHAINCRFSANSHSSNAINIALYINLAYGIRTWAPGSMSAFCNKMCIAAHKNRAYVPRISSHS